MAPWTLQQPFCLLCIPRNLLLRWPSTIMWLLLWNTVSVEWYNFWFYIKYHKKSVYFFSYILFIWINYWFIKSKLESLRSTWKYHIANNCISYKYLFHYEYCNHIFSRSFTPHHWYAFPKENKRIWICLGKQAYLLQLADDRSQITQE